LSGVTAITGGGAHTCALAAGGAAFCWGDGNYGELGNGSSSDYTPDAVAVSGLSSGVAAISAGGQHTCAVTSGGAVSCWGDNTYGELAAYGQLMNGGYGSNYWEVQYNAPVSGAVGAGVTSLAAGGAFEGSGPLPGFTCALTTAGTVWCWGDNSYGQLGNGTTISTDHVPTPKPVLGMSAGVTAVAMGNFHGCAIANGGAWCWGGNGFGDLGNGSQESSNVPVAVTGLSSGVTAIASGGDQTCAIVSGGAVMCWGENVGGPITSVEGGEHVTLQSSVPTTVSGLTSGYTSVAVGSGHACALSASGAVRCWGDGNLGQLGGTFSSATPLTVYSSGVTAIAAGDEYTCALTTSGGVECWGDRGEWLGDGSLTSGIVGIAAGASHACALTSQGGVLCWGVNSGGELGDGTATSSASPVAVSGLSSGVTAIAAGDGVTCAILVDGSIECWGWFTSKVPVPVPGLTSPVAAMAIGNNDVTWNDPAEFCALTTSGGLLCWGNDDTGQLGVGAASTPVAVVAP